MNTRRTELKETADAIATYSQGRLTKTQIAGILQTPTVAKDFALKLKSAKRFTLYTLNSDFFLYKIDF
jgi:hypothetical protein